MATIDLSNPTPTRAPLGVLDPLPRRLALTLAELQHIARAAGGAPLPFDVADPGPAHTLDSRLGPSRGAAENSAYLAARDSLHDPMESLIRRGLGTREGKVDAGLTGAVGLLATPEHALEIDASVHGVQVKAWHRQAGDAVATLATVDGLVFELAWFGVEQWAGELTRVASLPEEHRVLPSAVPDRLIVPFELLDSVGEAITTHRPDLVPVLIGQRTAQVRTADRVLGEAEATRALAGVHREALGRLRVLAARVRADDTRTVGVVSWVLLADGWHSLRATAETSGEPPTVEISVVRPEDLTAELAPVLQEVSG